MKAWPCLMLLTLAAIIGPGTPARLAQAQGKDPTPDEIAQAAGAPLIGKYAPPLTFRTLDGQKIDLAKFYGKKPVYLKFWATWCVPCRLQMPHFENVQRTMGGDMEVIAVDAGFNETRDAVVQYRQTMGLNMPVAIDDGRLADAFHLRITPQHIVIGRDGRVLYVGQLADAKLDRALAQATAEPAAAYSKADAPRPGGLRGPAPSLKTLTGESLSLSGGARPTVVFFFSPWCETYLKSSRPAMADACLKQREQASRLAGEPGVRWIGVAAGLWATQKDLAAYEHDHVLQMPLALDETGAFFRAFGVSDVPSFVVLDRAGHIAARTQSADQAARAAARLGAAKETL